MTSSNRCHTTELALNNTFYHCTSSYGCHTPRQALQNHPSGQLGGWATPWLAEEMQDGQHQRVDIPADAGTAHKGLMQSRLEEGLQ